MRRSLAAIGIAGLGLVGAGLYARRRQIIARAFGLRPPEYAVAVEYDLPVPMPDGTVLYADRFFPRASGQFPTILIRTPYGRPSETRLLGPGGLMGAALFAERGYNVVVQGVRGRFRSGGVFEPFVHEQEDGRTTLDWIAAQPWFEGNLGMWGPSYLGYTQWAVAADAPPFLKAIMPVIATSRFSHSFYPGGPFAYESSLRWATYLEATNRRSLDLVALVRVLRPQREATLAATLASAPLAEADRRATGAVQPFFQQWLAEPGPDGAYWSRVDFDRSLARVTPAVHLVAAWYDIFLRDQLADYTDLLAADARPYLTVLAGHHTSKSILGASVREGLVWFDALLRGRDVPRRRAVRLALLGAHETHEMDFWPPPAQLQRFYLHAGGWLRETRAQEAPASSFEYDPHDPTPSVGGPVLSPDGGARNQARVEARHDVLLFTSAPLEAPLDVLGYVRLEVFVRSNLAYFDLVGRLCAVDPDGRSINVCEGAIRVEPGVGERQPDGSLRLELDLWATARRFHAGQRLRLHICSGAHPRWNVNSGDGRALIDAVPAGLRAQQMVFHDAEHPSVLLLPVVSEATRQAMAGEQLQEVATP
ncbi:CocE/NonD family hydrolase [Candidatus Chloroploca mongolica]|uniref:CocE/NonD family hydrolase n=1 Tax=Candidatus Chloroploca mongolica TaxID=2528176 RepID=UPI0020B354EC|nr:CocE/NonD family hydrolase [Candidatus Chloroploca mongolica]